MYTLLLNPEHMCICSHLLTDESIIEKIRRHGGVVEKCAYRADLLCLVLNEIRTDGPLKTRQAEAWVSIGALRFMDNHEAFYIPDALSHIYQDADNLYLAELLMSIVIPKLGKGIVEGLNRFFFLIYARVPPANICMEIIQLEPPVFYLRSGRLLVATYCCQPEDLKSGTVFLSLKDIDE